jgi:hypothetical protein
MSRSEFTHLVPVVTESRLARQYDAVRARMPAPRRRGRAWVGWAVAAASTLALAIVLWRAGTARKNNLVDEAVLESGSTADSMRVTLGDGSSVQLGAATRARLTSAQPKAIRIDLERGTIEIEATHVDGRSFVVGAGAYALLGRAGSRRASRGACRSRRGRSGGGRRRKRRGDTAARCRRAMVGVRWRPFAALFVVTGSHTAGRALSDFADPSTRDRTAPSGSGNDDERGFVAP